jgi:hypothetical protein
MKKYEKIALKMELQIGMWLMSSNGQASKWRDTLVHGPEMFRLISRLAKDRSVPPKERDRLDEVVRCFLQTADSGLERADIAGYLRDVSVAAFAIASINQTIGSSTLRKYWRHEEDVVTLTLRIESEADQMLGAELWKALKAKFDLGNYGQGDPQAGYIKSLAHHSVRACKGRFS